MNLRNELEEYCALLDSNRITDRKKSCDRLSNLLDKEDVVTLLNKGDYISWKHIISSIQECLKKDADKISEDTRKKGSVNVKYPSAELFSQAIKAASREADANINISDLVGYIIGCMRDSKMKKCYEMTFLLVLKENILLNARCRGRLDKDDWTELFNFFKKSCEEKSLETLVLKCFMLVIKWGPCSGLPPSVLREQFEFITNLCYNISRDSPMNQQEDVLDILLDFCTHTAKDNRASCCKLGEDIFSNFIDLYELNGCEAKIKRQLVEFYLLQVLIHQPSGVYEEHPCAYASCWTTWKKCLKKVYSLLSKEINFYFINNQKNASFFLKKGESVTLWDNFTMLFVEVSRQLFLCSDVDITMTQNCSLISQGAQKRQKIEITLRNYINNIQESKSWLWIHIVCSVVKAYPNLLLGEDYLTLLQTLSMLQIKSNDYNVIDNIYTCLTVMQDVQNKIILNDYEVEINKEWKGIGESTLRAFALNQHKHATETLLEKLIIRKLVNSESVLLSYTSGVLNIGIQSIKTMETAVQNLSFNKTAKIFKETLMNCVLNPKNVKEYNYLLHQRTAKFLVNLTLQQWPKEDNQDEEMMQEIDKQSNLKDIYFQTAFEKAVVAPTIVNKKEGVRSVFNIDCEAASTLTSVIQRFVDGISSETIEHLLSTIILLLKVTSYMIKYNILDEMETDDCATMKIIRNILSNKNERIIRHLIYENRSDREAQKLLVCVTVLDQVFTFNDGTSLTTKIKDLIHIDLLRSLGAILNDLQEEDENKSEFKFELKKFVTRTLSNFGCISNTELNCDQECILKMMARPGYDCSSESDCVLLITFLNTFKHSKPGIISESILANVLVSVQDICNARWYYCSENAVEILNTLYILYPHLVAANDENIKTTSVELLYRFYGIRNEFGPEVSLALLNCMGRLCQLDPESNFCRWQNKEIIKYVPEFLISDYQEIRFKAIETLVVFFQVTSKSKQLQNFHRQEEVFSKMYEKSLEVFNITGEITQERRIDEITSRTASVLHTFTSIILCCNSWVEECVFTLVKLMYKKNLGSVYKVLEIINKHLCGTREMNCIENYLEYILEKWLNEDFECPRSKNIDHFPFGLFHCQTKSEFYLKHFEMCVPLLIVTDHNDVIAAAEQLSLNEKQIVELTAPKIFGRVLCTEVENMDNLVERNDILKYYVRVAGIDGLKQCLVHNLDQLLLCILSMLTDEKYVYEIFAENVIFFFKHLSIQQFQTCLKYVESFLCNGTNIISFLSNNNISQLEKILLQLKLNMYNVLTVDDKLKSFHRYSAWVNVVLNNLNDTDKFQYFFIKDTTYTLINLIETHRQTNSQVIVGVCGFLNSFLKNILPGNAETFENILTFTVNSLKNYATQETPITEICLEILHFLIVQNACHLIHAIERLDNFPQDPKFHSIRTVHTKIKYGNRKVSLEEELNFFLQHRDLTNRQDSLIHLREVLSKEKNQLKQMYNNLEHIRGFSEDCEKSSLHRLICTLAKISCSMNENVCFEAIRCLGEIGPADLTSLVLHHETRVSDIECTPFELLSAHLLSLLGDYIVNSDINLVKSASETLYIVLDSKEGRKVAETNVNFGCELDKKMFSPYLPRSKSSPTSSATVLTEVFTTKIDNDALWTPDLNTSHENWIVQLVTSLLETFTDKSYLPKLVPICKIAPKLCEHLLPLLVNLLLYINHRSINDVLSAKVNLFFSKHWNLTVPKYSPSSSINVNKKSVKCMLEVVSFARLQKNTVKSGRPMAALKLNYLKTAKAAEFCTAHFTALLYSQLWCQARIQEIQEDRNSNHDYVMLTTLDVIYENEDEQVGEALQNILRTAYRAVGDLDALPGCGNLFLLKPQFRVQHYKELEHWDQVTHFYEMQVSEGVDSARRDLMESLKKCSLYQLPLLCTRQSDESQYDCLWRLGQWNIEETRSDCLINPMNYEKFRFYSLKALHDSNERVFDTEKKMQSLCVIEHLKHTSLESSQNMYPVLTQLQAINEMEDFAAAIASRNFSSILTKWKLQDDLVRENNFQYVEPVIAQRIVMLNDYLKIRSNDQLKGYLVNMLLDFTDLARREGHFRVATRALEDLRCMSSLSDDVQTQIQLADAQLSWSVNDKMVTHHILKKLCKNSHINPKLRSRALKLLGQYMSETFSENRLVIISDYFFKSIDVIKNTERTTDDNNSILDTYDKVAQFADKGYQQIMAYMKSDSFQRKIVNMEKAKETASNLQKQSKKNIDVYKAAAIHVKQSTIDETEIENTKIERNHILKIALKYYMMNLLHIDKNNIRIFRVMALLLENRANPIIADTLKEVLPSYKYIMILPQLIPHISDNNADLYNKKVNKIVEKCAIEHPHHTLPLLLSLANSNNDKKFSDSNTTTFSNDTRVETANKLLNKLKTREELTDHINRLQQLSQALIELAYYKETDTSNNNRKKEFNIPRSQKITKIRNFDKVLLPTYNLPINKIGKYSSIVGIHSFGSVYHPVGGMNAPKRITCRGTDGKERSQLVKGHDDLRQDAVMQQVFTIINNLLSTNKQTRHLLIRTYKIVPLSMRSGILEWVDNSMPLGDYLVGVDNQPGAHQLYRPKDISPASCREMIKKSADKTADRKLETYKAICKKFKPVLHKFFEKFFPHPTIWYERKRAYIHSVATTSMCGYILGIGDRHVSNIVIDKITAEVIHIDFGIAFEQGRVLPTPETVPFRLTRDVVDGMGVSGIEGLFRRSCEQTMEVLRQNSQTIVTTLEVLLYDPLYVWTVTSAEANKRQTDDESDLNNLLSESDEDTTVNITADRALLRLREKLQGTELGNPTSIEHQVGTLIQQAMDPANLCKLFHGWQAYL